MKKLYTLILSMLCVMPAMAQFTIEEEQKTARPEVTDTVKVTDTNSDYFNEARYRAERKEIRNQRNYLEYGASVQGTLTAQNDAWIRTSGGDNSIAAVAALRLHHIFTKDKFTIETKVDGKFGYNRMKVEFAREDGTKYDEGIWFKNQDEILLSTAPAYVFKKNWSFGSIIKFRTQFANGYVSRTEQEGIHRKSRFMSPGYFDVSVGFTYTSPSKKLPFKINLSPIATNATFVRSESVRENGYTYGITDPADRSLWEGGSSVQIDFDRTWGKNGWLRYRTTFYSFYGWISSMSTDNKYRKFDHYKAAYANWESNQGAAAQKPVLTIHPTMRWENTIEIKATKFISTQIYFQLFYNRAQCYDVQLQTLLSVGFSYTFKNREK